jgi:hypothetical protein
MAFQVSGKMIANERDQAQIGQRQMMRKLMLSMNFSTESTPWRVCVAPMLDWTDFSDVFIGANRRGMPGM